MINPTQTDPPPWFRIHSPWCEAHPSGIHQEGLFASRLIPRATRVIEYLGEKITKAEAELRGLRQMREAVHDGGGAVYLFSLDEHHDLDGNFDWNPARLANHSCDPNCATDIIEGRIYIIALRDIPPGEEITFDYQLDLEDWQAHPCRCGAENCIGYIVSRELWPELEKEIRSRRQSKKLTFSQ